MYKGVMKYYGAERWLYTHKLKFVAKIVKTFIRVFFSATIPYTAKIGKGTVLPHGGLGIVFHDETVIGENCKVQANVVIGGRNGKSGAPKIGNGVLIGAGAKIMGDITIGDNVAIGANAVVTKSVPDNVVVVGIPAKIVRHLEPGEARKM